MTFPNMPERKVRSLLLRPRGRMARMNLRHAAALMLVGWTLFIPEVGKTIPKECSSCAVTTEARAMVGPEFQTETECEKAGHEWVRDFYTKAERNGERVAFPPATPECTRNKPN